MIRYRSFRNTDPPHLAELWCSHQPTRPLVQPMTAALLEKSVLSKPYFDRHGLIIAEDDERILGFTHAGFGSDAERKGLSTQTGATCMLMAGPHEDRDSIVRELLRRSEEYLIERGARLLLAGSVYPANAFYLGLYGSSKSPGLLESDAETLHWFREANYQQTGTHRILQRRLAGFRPTVDRVQMQLRRHYRVEPDTDPPTDSWWEACTIGQTDRTRYRLSEKGGGLPCGWVVFWDMEPISNSWGVSTIGLMDLHVDTELRRKGLGTFMVGEALRSMQGNGTALAEVQVPGENEAALALFRKLGFQEIDRGFILQKEVQPE